MYQREGKTLNFRVAHLATGLRSPTSPQTETVKPLGPEGCWAPAPPQGTPWEGNGGAAVPPWAGRLRALSVRGLRPTHKFFTG